MDKTWGQGQEALIIGMVLDVANGRFDGFIPEDFESSFYKALDMDTSKHDQIGGQKLNLIPALVDFLKEIAQIRRQSSLVDLIDYPEEEIEAARDDVRYALQTAIDLYEATSWIYSQKASGLRLAAWSAEHFTRSNKAFAF